MQLEVAKLAKKRDSLAIGSTEDPIGLHMD